MKKAFGFIAVVFALFVGYNAYNKKETIKIDKLALANIEALATGAEAEFQWYKKRISTFKSSNTYPSADSIYWTTESIYTISCPYLSLKEEFCVSGEEKITTVIKRNI